MGAPRVRRGQHRGCSGVPLAPPISILRYQMSNDLPSPSAGSPPQSLDRPAPTTRTDTISLISLAQLSVRQTPPWRWLNDLWVGTVAPKDHPLHVPRIAAQALEEQGRNGCCHLPLCRVGSRPRVEQIQYPCFLVPQASTKLLLS